MDLFEMYKKSALETALNEFGEKYHDFCSDHTCTTCPLAPDPHLPVPAFHNWRQQCKANVIDHLTEANKKMDEAIAKAEEVKRKRNEYAEKLLFAIKNRIRDLEYHAMRDADYVILNPDDYALLKSCTTVCLTCCLTDGPDTSYTSIYGMRSVCDRSIEIPEYCPWCGANKKMYAVRKRNKSADQWLKEFEESKAEFFPAYRKFCLAWRRMNRASAYLTRAFRDQGEDAVKPYRMPRISINRDARRFAEEDGDE